MSSKNFIIKNGLTIGSTEVINSSGIIQGSAVNEAIDDRLNSTLTAGSGISLAYDDANNSLTITGNVGDITGVNAGAGLTGTATSGDATLNVGAGTGITVNADDIAVDMTAFDTGNLSEGSNLYYTDARADARVQAAIDTDTAFGSASDTLVPSQLAVKTYVDAQVDTVDSLSELSGDTDDVTEGSTNLYFTNERADARITNALIDEDDMSSNSATKIPSQQSVKAFVESQVASKDALSELSGTTDDVTEGSTNQYFTNERVDDRVNALITAGTNITTSYDDANGTLTINSSGKTEEEIEDIVNGLVVGGTNITSTYNDAAGTLTLAGLSDSDIRGLVSAGGDLSYNSSTGAFSFTERTDAEVRGLVSVTDSAGDGTLSYNSTTGVITYSGITDAQVRGKVSVTDAGGDGSLAYNSGTGVITYTGPSASETRAHFSAGTGVSISSGQVSIGQSVGTSDNVSFGDLILSGDLTVNGTTTTVNTATLNVSDNIITLNNDVTGTPSQDAGIEVERGTSANVSLTWDESEDEWTFGSYNVKASSFEGSLTGNVTGNLTGNVTGTVSSLSNHDTDDVSEGSTNLYHTTARARGSISAGGDLSYNSGTGVISFTERTDAEVQGLITGGTGVSVSSGQVSIGQAVSTSSNVQFTQITTNYANNSGGVARNIYQNTSAPTSGDGQVGDLWILYS
jgi:hypothetical protein